MDDLEKLFEGMDPHYYEVSVFDFENNEMRKPEKGNKYEEALFRFVVKRDRILNIYDFQNPEEAVEYLYSSMGFDTYNLSHLNSLSFKMDSEFYEEVLDYIYEKLSFDSKDDFYSFINTNGIPDILVVDEEKSKVNELFFVEVKSNNGVLKKDQLKWIFKLSEGIKVLVTFLEGGYYDK